MGGGGAVHRGSGQSPGRARDALDGRRGPAGARWVTPRTGGADRAPTAASPPLRTTLRTNTDANMKYTLRKHSTRVRETLPSLTTFRIRRITELWMLFILFCALMTCATADVSSDEAPRIRPAESPLILETGSRLVLTCEGVATLSWENPNLDQTVEIGRSGKDALTGELTSSLTINSLVAADTGYYRCVRTDKTDRKWTSDPLYVYVTDDAGPLFLEAGQTDLEHFLDQASVIPCRLTDPRADVTLLPVEALGNGSSAGGGLGPGAVGFDPRVGFTLAAELSDYSGNVSCRAQLGSRVQVQTFSVTIAVAPELSVSEEGLVIADGQLVITENSTLELVCRGGHMIDWSVPAGVPAGRFGESHVETLIPDQSPVYRSTLTLNSALWTDTGAYSCAYARYDGLASASVDASVYVYVKSEDPARFFLPQPDREILTSQVAANLTLPCRITDPARASELHLLVFYPTTLVENEGFKSQWQMHYDPRVGYTVWPQLSFGPTAPVIRRLTMICQLNSEVRLSFKVYDEQYSNGTFLPSIVPSATRLIQGTEYTVTCKIAIPFFFYITWDSTTIPDIQISYPNQTIIPSGEVMENGGYSIITDNTTTTVLTQRTLTIENVSLLNSGQYSCRVRNIELDVVVNTSLVVFERGFVRLTHRDAATVTGGVAVAEGVEGQPRLCLHAVLASFPGASALWSRAGQTLEGAPNGTEPRFTALEEPSSNSSSSGDRLLSGCLRDLTVADGGVYDLTAWNDYETRSLTFRLKILESPEVSVTVSPQPQYGHPPLFVVDQEYRLECAARGNPRPVLAWRWQSCMDRLCTDIARLADDRWTEHRSDQWLFGRPEEARTADPLSAVSVLSVRGPPESGVFRCLALSEKFEEPAWADVEYRLTELPFALPASRVDKEVFVSDPANLTCHASIYAFADALAWDWTPSGNDSEALDIEADDPRVWTPAQAGYQHRSVLGIASASANSTGVYRCRARKKNTNELVVVYEVQLLTKEIVPPTFVRELLPEYHLDRRRENLITLECQVRGQPRPSLVWLKDGLPLTGLNQSLARPLPEVAVNDTLTGRLALGPAVSWRHGGEYECCAPVRGSQNRSVCSVTAVVIGESPTAKITNQSLNGRVGESIRIDCRTSGLPWPTVTWQREIEGSTRLTSVPSELYSRQGNSLLLETLKESDQGKYFCNATNRHGTELAEATLFIQGDSSLLMPILVAGITAGIICLFACICMVLMAKKLCLYARTARRSSNLELGTVTPRPLRGPMSPFRMSFREEFADQLPFDPKWEFPRDRLKLGAMIGQGAFGMVLKGVALGINMNDRYVPVAVKTVKSDASQVDRKALFGELKMLIQVGHHLNVVNFLGACTQDSPPLVIVEFCPYGNLCDYVRSKRDSFAARRPETEETEEEGEKAAAEELNYADLILREAAVSEPLAAEYELVDKEAKMVAEKCLTVEDLVCFCFQVARGMEFLASRKCIHRDLAARNVLLAENNVVKICDFGLARTLYHDSDYIGSGKGLLPIKWMAPEAIFDKVFTTYSDIWSFGIFTWEVFSLGGSPYPGIQVDERFYDKMKSGYRMSRPEHAPKEVYQLMLECWSDEPKDRPMFSELTEKFGELLESNTRQEYIDLNIPYQEGHYCELDFGKAAGNNRNPATIAEEDGESAEAAAAEGEEEEDAMVASFNDPTYHKGPRGAATAAPSEGHQDSPSANASEPDKSGVQQEAATAAGDNMPEDPYRRGTSDNDDQCHRYTSLRATRPSCAPDGTVAQAPSTGLESSDGEPTHTYSSIRGQRPNRTNGAPSMPTNEEEDSRPHLYASIRLARQPQTTNSDPAPEERARGESDAATSPSEAASLLGEESIGGVESPAVSDATPTGRGSPRPERPALPKRDFSTTSWSPETETLLSAQSLTADSDQQLVKPVYV